MGTQEDIQESINSRLEIDANLLEGGFSQDIIGSVSYELANIKDTELDEIADRCFVATAENDDLDKVGGDYGLPRRESEAAIVYLKITGDQYAVINQNVKAVFNNLVFTVQEYKKINSSGVVTVKAKCETLGTIGNVPADSINKFLTDYAGLKTVNNPEPAYDGFDREDDEIYRQRILDYLAEDATNANEAQYEKWAREVTGVQKAVIKPAEIMGAGNVGVFISAIEAKVSEDLKQDESDEVADAILEKSQNGAFSNSQIKKLCAKAVRKGSTNLKDNMIQLIQATPPEISKKELDKFSREITQIQGI